MKQFVSVLSMMLFSVTTATAQQTFTVCGPQEFCYCWDGVSLGTYTFVACPDSLSNPYVNILFCSGAMPPVDVLRGYSGLDEFGEPITSLNGSFPNLSGASGVSTSIDGAHLEFDFSSASFCQGGTNAPVRWWVWTGAPASPPGPGDCVGTEPLCLNTQVASHAAAPRNWVRIADDQLLLASYARGNSIEVLDASGRVATRIAVQGRTSVTVPSGLSPGVYVLRMQADGRELTERVSLGH